MFSVGIRPCTGAILVLVFALTQGMFWAGVAATFAMAIGTAITVAALATLALGSRELALRLGGGKRCLCRSRMDYLFPRRCGPDHFLFGATLFARLLGACAALLDLAKPYCLLRNADG